MDIHASSEPMTLGSPTSPKPGPGAQFLPGFLMGDLPAPASPQPRAFNLSTPTTEHRSFQHTGGSQPVVPAPKDKSGAPPIRSIYDDLTSTAAIATTPLSSHKQPFSMFQSPLLGSTPGTVSSSSCRQVILSPAQVDPFYSQGEALSSDDHLDQTWVTVFGFPPASASYILLQFAQYGNILKHTMSSPGNWMHLQYQSVLQARKALSKDGKVFGDWLMVGVKPCIDKAVMEASEAVNNSTIISPAPSALFSPAHGGLPSTPRSSMRPLSAAYKASSDDYQVLTDRQTPRKEDSVVSKAMTYMFGW